MKVNERGKRKMMEGRATERQGANVKEGNPMENTGRTKGAWNEKGARIEKVSRE